MSKVPRSTLALLLCATVAGGGGAMAYSATTASAPIVYNGCVSHATGLLRVSPTTGCRRGEYAISWNNVGPQGPIGPQGVPGAAAPPLTVTARVENVTVAPGAFGRTTATCLAGEQIVSGGARSVHEVTGPTPSGGRPSVVEQVPEPRAPLLESEMTAAGSWLASVHNDAPYSTVLEVQAVCAAR